MIYDIKKNPFDTPNIEFIINDYSLGVYFTHQTVSLSICIYYNFVITLRPTVVLTLGPLVNTLN